MPINPKFYLIEPEENPLTLKEMKTILSRVDNETRIFVIGDLEQKDSTEQTNGFSSAFEKMKENFSMDSVNLSKEKSDE